MKKLMNRGATYFKKPRIMTPQPKKSKSLSKTGFPLDNIKKHLKSLPMHHTTPKCD